MRNSKAAVLRSLEEACWDGTTRRSEYEISKWEDEND
jgi:hypothetical protein